LHSLVVYQVSDFLLVLVPFQDAWSEPT
jgi:hypothetical protein